MMRAVGATSAVNSRLNSTRTWDAGTRYRSRGAKRPVGGAKQWTLMSTAATVTAIRTTIGTIRRAPRAYGGQGCVLRLRVG
jgi:hypothetical protein